jgi:hypothetical protein
MGDFGIFEHSLAFTPESSPLRSSFLLESLGHAKSDALSATIILDEFNASSFQRLAQCGFVRERYWDFPINDLRPTDGCYADF